MNFVHKIFRGDKGIWMIFTVLCLISILEVFSATSTLTYKQGYLGPIMRHVYFLLGGTGIVLLAHASRPRYFSLLGILLPVAWFFLVILLIYKKLDWGFMKIVTENQASRWFDLFGIRFQPSEVAKLSLIVVTAFLLSWRDDGDRRLLKWILWLAAGTCALIFKENGSTAILLAIVIWLMLIIGNIPAKYKFRITLVLVLAAASFYAFIRYTPEEVLNSKVVNKILPRADTWQRRILAKTPDVRDPNFKIVAEKGENNNYQESHANIAIARGGIFGVVPGNSQERDYLPQAYSDFIYAIIIEETGIAGGIGILALYIFLFIRAGIIANRCERLFPKYLVMGSALILVSQALSNMAVAVGLIPITGQPLPLISRGGTSTLINCVYMGIMLSVSRFNNPKGIRREEEIAEENENAAVEKLLNEDLNVEDDITDEITDEEESSL